MITEKEYYKIIDICDKILLSPNTGIERKAISWLHILNEHPVNLSKYDSIFENRMSLSGIVRHSGSLLRTYVSSVTQVPLSKELKFLPNQTEVLFVSHLLNISQVQSSSDFYFGELPEFFLNKGTSNVVALINQTNQSLKNDDLKWPSELAPRIVLNKKIDFVDEIAFFKLLLNESLRLLYQSRNSKNLLEKQIFRSAAQEAISIESINALRLFHQVLLLVSQLRPKAIFVTYEGHAWERLVFMAARHIIPDICCIGYQHAILFPKQHAILRRLEKNYDPDIILTAGLVGYDKIKKSSNFKKVKVDILGTHRHISDSQEKTLRQKNCLIIPDGVVGECLFLFDFALKCAVMQPNITFIFRLHPVVSFAEIIARDERGKKLPRNFYLSNNTFSEDLSCSRWALYRGSGSAVHAACVGIRPIYVSRSREMYIDPLYELKTWRKIVTTSSEVQDIISSDLNANASSIKKEAMTSIQYCEKYFMPLNVSVLNSFLSNT